MRKVSFETAKLVAKAGYPTCKERYYDHQYSLASDSSIIKQYSAETCLLYDDLIPALYQAEICDWLRKEKGIHITADLEYLLDELDKPAPNWFMIVSCIEDGHCPRAVYESPARMGLYLTFEEAIEEGIKCVLLNLDNLDE